MEPHHPEAWRVARHGLAESLKTQREVYAQPHANMLTDAVLIYLAKNGFKIIKIEPVPEPEKAKPGKFWEDLEENLKDAKFRRAYVKDFQKLMGDR